MTNIIEMQILLKSIIKSLPEHVSQGQKKRMMKKHQILRKIIPYVEEISTMTNISEMHILKKSIIKSPHEVV